MTTKLTFKGSPLTTLDKTLTVGETLPEIKLTAVDMSDLATSRFLGKPLLVSVIPSLDTSVCSLESKRFNTEAAKLADTVTVLTVSMDLPFAQKRWCAAEGAANLVLGSDYKYREASQRWGTLIKEWGLLCRAVLVTDASGKITFVEYVSEVSAEPNYDNALQALVTAHG